MIAARARFEVRGDNRPLLAEFGDMLVQSSSQEPSQCGHSERGAR